MSDRRIVVVVNPASGHGAARKHLPTIEKAVHESLPNHPDVIISQSAKHIQDLAAQAVRDKVDIFAICGGDGSAHYALQPLVHTPTALAILPIGSGNDLAMNAGIPSDFTAALQLLTRGVPRSIDVAKTQSGFYGCIGGIGFDSEVTRRANNRNGWIRGAALYPFAIVTTLISFRPRAARIRWDGGQSFEEPIMFAVFANAASYGRGIRIAPKAKLDDGWLDVCIVKAMSKAELIRTYPKAYKGTHVNHPKLVQFRAQSISIEADEPLELYGDGEFMESTPVEIQVVPKALHVIVPPHS
ncbi:MAG: diacylglycerol kinase family lipid kinase [Acidobacteriia bacterium]|nr:diacylglycerol kinase family lipid kinase [Terriglobia bacterium]